MERLIDANKLKADFIGKRYGVQAIEYVIDQQPTVDAEPVKRGRWEYVKKRLARGGYVDAGECSICHKIIMPHLKPNYCPNCGAKMDEDRDYERAVEQLEHDMMFEPTYNPEDGSM